MIPYRLDLLHAAIFNSEPVLVAPIQNDALNVSDADAFSRFIPLLMAEQESLAGVDSSSKVGFEVLSQFLRTASNVIENTSGSSAQGGHYESIEGVRELMERLKIASQRDHGEGSNKSHITRACHGTLSILHNLLVHKTPHRHQRNEQHVESLFAAVQNTTEKDWAHVPYLHLFM